MTKLGSRGGDVSGKMLVYTVNKEGKLLPTTSYLQYPQNISSSCSDPCGTGQYRVGVDPASSDLSGARFENGSSGQHQTLDSPRHNILAPTVRVVYDKHDKSYEQLLVSLTLD